MILNLTTCQARNTHAITATVTEYLARQLNLEARFTIAPSWNERVQGVMSGSIQIGWMCGYPYVQAMLQPDPPLTLLALPVMSGARYQDRPIYFSDVVVRRESDRIQFTDLRGATWAYNEAGSHSGYHIVRHRLAQIGETGKFFGKAVESGAHLRSLEMVLAGEADGAALDSTVLEMALDEDPALAQRIRMIDVLGPSPIPPWVIHKSVPEPLRRAIRQALLQMHQTVAGRQILALGKVARFETAVDAHYDTLRQMLHTAQNINL